MSVYVVKEWEVARQADAGGNFVNLRGRQEGLISWLLALVGIDPTVQLRVTKDNVHFESRTFWGFTKRIIPLNKISETLCGFASPL